MAITGQLYRFYKDLQLCSALPQGGSILEIGEANWYGDRHPRDFQLCPGREYDPFSVAKECYRKLFGCTDIVSIDNHGTEAALKCDLNVDVPYQLADRKFSTVINNGTAEHIFNIANVFRVMHDYCEPGGVMVHAAPFTGWIDHGFYCLQPTLFFDVAKANRYQVVNIAVESIAKHSLVYVRDRDEVRELVKHGIPDNTCLLVALRKMRDAPFQIPQQHIYTNATQSDTTAWHQLR